MKRYLVPRKTGQEACPTMQTRVGQASWPVGVFFCSLLAVGAGATAAFFQVPAAKVAADFVPPGALLTLEAKDFASLLRDWNGSPEKRAWLESANFASFSRSNLYLKLEAAKNEFASAAGVPIETPLLEAVAGADSAAAIYDIGRLQFLYVTRLPSARAVQTALWQSRASFSPRSASGQTFYVRVDPGSNRVAAFAAVNDWLILATREDLIAGALGLISGQGDSVRKERWYERASAAAKARGDLRLVMDLARVARTPYFRSYWIQRNTSEVRAFTTGIADAHRSAGEIREDRVLLREEPGQPVSNSLGQIVKLAPAGTGLYRAWARPTAAEAAALLARNVLAPKVSSEPASQIAPTLDLRDEADGSEADLEIRIDEPPFAEPAAVFAAEPVRRLLEGMRIEAMMQVESSRVLADGVFVDTEAAIVIQTADAWDAGAVRAALTDSIRSLWGFNLAIDVNGGTVIVSRSSDLAARISARRSAADSGLTGAYTAHFDHGVEQPSYAKMMKLIDHPFIQSQPEGEGIAREPQFFSENIASLSGVLGRVESANIVVRDTGAALEQTVTYRLKP